MPAPRTASYLTNLFPIETPGLCFTRAQSNSNIPYISLIHFVHCLPLPWVQGLDLFCTGVYPQCLGQLWALGTYVRWMTFPEIGSEVWEPGRGLVHQILVEEAGNRMLPGEWPVSSFMVGYNASHSHSYCRFLKYLFNSDLPFKQSSTILMSQWIRKYTINEILRKFRYL